MKKTLKKILELPLPSWNWDPEKASYKNFTASEADALITIVHETHLQDIEEVEIKEALEWASTQAYRILASFFDTKHIPIFIEWIFAPKFDDNDLYMEDVILILSRYGAPAIQPCIDALNDQDEDETNRMILCDILFNIADDGIESELIYQYFINYIKEKHFSRLLNSHIICSFPEAQKRENLDIIRDCFADHLVDLSMAGDFVELEIKLGLRKKRSTPCENLYEADRKELHLALKKRLGPRPSFDRPGKLFMYLLELYGRDNGITHPTMIDGYLTAVHLDLLPQTPSDFIPPIWDANQVYTPSWEDPEEARFFESMILSMHYNVDENLKNKKLQPVLSTIVELPHSLWLRGFLKGFYAWNSSDFIPEENDLSELEDKTISLVFDILTEERKEPDEKRTDINLLIKKLHTTLYQLYEENNSELEFNPFILDDQLSLSETLTRDAPKISRNAPCPCGSGKKYKHCCMN